jgi:hypothetical protein
MKETFDKIITWVKNNLWLAIGGAAIITLLFFPKLFSATTRRRRRIRPVTTRARSGRRLPRSVGRRKYTSGGKAKKPWQIKGSLAARRHMAQIRRRRRK